MHFNPKYGDGRDPPNKLGGYIEKEELMSGAHSLVQGDFQAKLTDQL